MKKHISTGILFLVVLLAQAQQPTEEIDLEQFAERLFQVQDQDIDYEDIYESLLLYYTNPLNLNKTSQEELASLYILSPVQLQSFFDYREQNGPLLSIYELQAIQGFDLNVIEQLLPFVTVKESQADARPLLERMWQEENKYLLLRYTRILEDQRGFNPEEDNPYEGSPDKLYGRFRMSHRNDFSVGFTFEKDAGEALGFENGKTGFDYVSGHVLLENQGPFRQMAVGDYQLQVGQGLIFGAGFNPGKGAETVNTVKRNTLGIRPYTSVLETGFFRGGALSAPVGDFTITAFGSYLKQDARIQEADTLEERFDSFVSSILNSGLHRTESEVAARDQVEETNLGAVIEFEPFRRLNLGISALSTRYSSFVQRTPSNYNQFEFAGTQNTVAGVFGSYQWQTFNFFGEAARSTSGGIGAIGGFIGSLSGSLDMAVSVRNYDKNFHSFYGNAFGEGSRAINEKGIYWGIKYRPTKKYTLAAYYDKFSFPWLRFGVDAPSEGSEWLARFTYKPVRDIVAYVQVRQENKETSIDDGNLSRLVYRNKINYLFNVDYRLGDYLQLKSRVQTSTVDEGGVFTKGYAIIQDVNVSYGKFKLSTRMALFETDNFDNAQYVYERDVLYAFSIPSYSGQGIRNYVLLQYKMNRRFDFWIRWARFVYRDRDEVGSGLDESQGPNRTQVKGMMRIRF